MRKSGMYLHLSTNVIRLPMAIIFLPQLSVWMQGLTCRYRATHSACARVLRCISNTAFAITSGGGPCGCLISGLGLFRQHFLNFFPLPHGQLSFLPVTFHSPTKLPTQNLQE